VDRRAELPAVAEKQLAAGRCREIGARTRSDTGRKASTVPGAIVKLPVPLTEG
jgi:hypothetical protein